MPPRTPATDWTTIAPCMEVVLCPRVTFEVLWRVEAPGTVLVWANMNVSISLEMITSWDIRTHPKPRSTSRHLGYEIVWDTLGTCWGSILYCGLCSHYPTKDPTWETYLTEDKNRDEGVKELTRLPWWTASGRRPISRAKHLVQTVWWHCLFSCFRRGA